MKSPPNNYTKEILGCAVWIVLAIGLFASPAGKKLLTKIQDHLPATSGGSARMDRSSSRLWTLVDGREVKGRVLLVDERAKTVRIALEDGNAQKSFRLDEFSPYDRERLLRATNHPPPR